MIHKKQIKKVIEIKKLKKMQ